MKCSHYSLGLAVHIGDSSTGEREEEKDPGLHSKFEDNLCHMTPCLNQSFPDSPVKPYPYLILRDSLSVMSKRNLSAWCFSYHTYP